MADIQDQHVTQIGGRQVRWGFVNVGPSQGDASVTIENWDKDGDFRGFRDSMVKMCHNDVL